MKRWTGEMLLGLAGFHSLIALALGTGVFHRLRIDAWAEVDLGAHTEGALRGLTGSPLVGAAMPGHAAEFGLFWFGVAGLWLALLGATLVWLRRTHGILAPRFLAWGLGAISVVGVVVMPISGFWLLLVTVILIAPGTSRAAARPVVHLEGRAGLHTP